jgi:hypothetical protein
MTRHPALVGGGARIAAVALTTVALTMVLLGPARPAAATPAQAPPPAESPCATAAPGDGGEVDTVLPDDCWGRFPSSHYDIGCDEGAWNHLSRKVYCTFTDLAFQGSRAATALTLWLIEWSYGFGVYDRLGGHAITIADTYQTNLIGPLGLSELVWFAAVAWAGFATLRGKITMAAGELVMSFVCAVLAGIFLANPAGYLQGLFDTMGSTSGAIFATANGDAPPENGVDADAVLAPLQAQIHSAFVEQPYDILNWGAPLSGQCAAARDQILVDGPHGNDDEPRDAMDAAGCAEASDFNHDPNGTRLFGAVLTLVAALVMAVLIILVAITVVVAQVVAIILFSIAPFALLAAVLPAGGRALAWAWLGALGRVVLAVVGMSFLLSLLLLTVQAMLAGTADASLVERFALMNLTVVVMFLARKRILAGGHTIASQLAHRASTRRIGGERTAGWGAPAAVAGVTGFAVGASMGPDRPTRSGRLAGTAVRDHRANRRVAHQGKAAERRANRTVARQRTEITMDGEGNPQRRSAVSVDGPAPKSRRARSARAKVERRATRTHSRTERRGFTARPAPPGDPLVESQTGDPDVGVDVEA